MSLTEWYQSLSSNEKLILTETIYLGYYNSDFPLAQNKFHIGMIGLLSKVGIEKAIERRIKYFEHGSLQNSLVELLRSLQKSVACCSD